MDWIGVDWVETAKSLEEFVSKVDRETSRQVIRTNIATEGREGKRERLVGKNATHSVRFSREPETRTRWIHMGGDEESRESVGCARWERNAR